MDEDLENKISYLEQYIHDLEKEKERDLLEMKRLRMKSERLIQDLDYQHEINKILQDNQDDHLTEISATQSQEYKLESKHLHGQYRRGTAN